MQLRIGPKLEWGPDSVCEIYLALHENGNIFYQFTGLNGGPAHPQVLHNVLTIARDSIVKSYNVGVPGGVEMKNVTEIAPDGRTALYPEVKEPA